MAILVIYCFEIVNVDECCGGNVLESQCLFFVITAVIDFQLHILVNLMVGLLYSFTNREIDISILDHVVGHMAQHLKNSSFAIHLYIFCKDYINLIVKEFKLMSDSFLLKDFSRNTVLATAVSVPDLETVVHVFAKLSFFVHHTVISTIGIKKTCILKHRL